MRTIAHVTSTMFVALVVVACSDGNSTGIDEDSATTSGSSQSTTSTSGGGSSTGAHSSTQTSTASHTTTATSSVRNDGGAGDDAGSESESTTDETADASRPDGSAVDADASTTAPEVPADDAAVDAGDAAVQSDASVRGPGNQCAAIPLKCGDQVHHDTSDMGVDLWWAYASSQRGDIGKEVLYALSLESQCVVTVVMSDLASDLDLFLLEECNADDSTMSDIVNSRQASSTPIDIQTIEQMTFIADEQDLYYVVVDGYDGDEGSYTLDVECNCE